MPLRTHQPSDGNRRPVDKQFYECNIARLDIVFHGVRVHEGMRRFPVDHVPGRLGQEHATHVATPSHVVAPI